MLGLLAVLGLGWELGTTCGLIPILPWASGRVWAVCTAGGTGGGCTEVLSMHLPQSCSNPFLERGAEVEMLSLGGGRCALLMVPVPILCRTGAAAPSSSSS